MASPLFSKGFFRNLVLEQAFRQQALEPVILQLKFFEQIGIRDAHTAKFAAPEVVIDLPEVMLSAELGNRHARLRFGQKANDLFFGEPLLQFQSPPAGLDS
jgi:hypothetical protein